MKWKSESPQYNLSAYYIEQGELDTDLAARVVGTLASADVVGSWHRFRLEQLLGQSIWIACWLYEPLEIKKVVIKRIDKHGWYDGSNFYGFCSVKIIDEPSCVIYEISPTLNDI